MATSVELSDLRFADDHDEIESRTMRDKENGENMDMGIRHNDEGGTDDFENRRRIAFGQPECEGEDCPLPSDSHGFIPKKIKPLDMNLYATKKTVAQGMMDLALLTANANQLRYVLESGSHNGVYFYLSVVLISLSILLQLVIGVLLIFVGRCNVNEDKCAQKADRLNNWVVFMIAIGVALIFVGKYNMKRDDHAVKADRLNNWVVLGVFLITSVNVFISAFGVDPAEKVDPALIIEAAIHAVRSGSRSNSTPI